MRYCIIALVLLRGRTYNGGAYTQGGPRACDNTVSTAPDSDSS